MSSATYKDFCIDAVDAWTLGQFWAPVLGLAYHQEENGDSHLLGPTPAHTVWINRVPEAKTVKNRIHLDVIGTSAAELVDLGATVLDADSFTWVLMADPEGHEFCLFTSPPPGAYRLHEIVVDVRDHRLVARWWADVLGGNVVEDDRGFSSVEGAAGVPFDALTFLPVPEPEQLKNRVHLDLVVPDVDALAAAGATLLRHQGDDPTKQWSVWADPEGNEFCAFDPAAA